MAEEGAEGAENTVRIEWSLDTWITVGTPELCQQVEICAPPLG